MKRDSRSADERQAAREARQRERVARDEDPPVEDEEGLPVEEQARPPEPDGGWEPPEMRSMSRYGGGIDVYMRRRLIALLAIVALAVALFLVLGGC